MGRGETALSAAAERETYRGVVFPWLCDTMGHLATQHYMAMFDVASLHFLAMVGPPLSELTAQGMGWADVRHEISYKREVRTGELLIIRSCLLSIGNSSLRYRHTMAGEDDGIRAVLEAVSVHFDLRSRVKNKLPLLRNILGS
jgi:acyl-CoA thioester hydrolase